MERTGLSLLSEMGTGYPYFGEEIRSRPQGVVWKTNYQPAPLWICWWKVLGDRLKKHRESKGLLFLCRSCMAVAPPLPTRPTGGPAPELWKPWFPNSLCSPRLGMVAVPCCWLISALLSHLCFGLLSPSLL